MKGFSTRTLSIRLKELEKSGILERHRYNEIPPRVEYTLTTKGQELVGFRVKYAAVDEEMGQSKAIQ